MTSNPQEEDTNSRLVKDITRSIPSIAAWFTVLGFSSIVLSFVFELGYFFVLGQRFMGALSSYDYVNHAIIAMTFLVIGSQIIEFTMARSEEKQHLNALALRASTDVSDHEKLGRMQVIRNVKGISSLVLMLIGALVLPAIPAAALIIWSLITSMITSVLFTGKGRPFYERRVYVFGIQLITTLILSFVIGFSTASNDVYRSRFDYTISIDAYKDQKSANVLRLIGGGMIYILSDAPDRIRYSPWEHIAYVEGKTDPERPARLLDWLLRWLHPAETSPQGK